MKVFENNLLYILLLASLFGYVFLADIMMSFLGLSFAKLLFAIGTFGCGIVCCTLYYDQLRLKEYLFVPIIIIFLYVFVFHSTQSLSYFYTAIFGFFLIQAPRRTVKFIDCIFILQFVLVVFEVSFQNLLYTKVTTGIFDVHELEQNTELFDYSGFRAKGLFTGCLEATSFVIYYSFLNRNKKNKTFFAFLMALLLNGRLAMMMTFGIWIYNIIIFYRQKGVSGRTIKTVIFFVSGVTFLILISFAANYQRIQHLLNVFNPESVDFAGRIESYVLAYNEYFFNYGITGKLWGSTYELIRVIDGREMAAESDILGMLLEIGFIGFLFIIFNIIRAYRRTNEKLFEKKCISFKFVVICLLVCMIEYRHVGGNVRGVLFWLLLMTSYFTNIGKNQNPVKKLCKTDPNRISKRLTWK